MGGCPWPGRTRPVRVGQSGPVVAWLSRPVCARAVQAIPRRSCDCHRPLLPAALTVEVGVDERLDWGLIKGIAYRLRNADPLILGNFGLRPKAGATAEGLCELPESAALDRLTGHADMTRITGQSYRQQKQPDEANG